MLTFQSSRLLSAKSITGDSAATLVPGRLPGQGVSVNLQRARQLVCCLIAASFASLLCSYPAAATEQPQSPEQAATEQAADAEQWIQLFNGRDLDDWTIKIRYHELGKNFNDTFRVEDGLLKVGYEGYEKFNETFGHIFYNTPYSHYRLRVEYRFVGDQCLGGPGWAFRNSGLMLHGEDPKTMSVDQDFPASIEVQLLGGNGKAARTTANLCTPGTNVVMDGELITRHCSSSSSKTYHGDDWVVCEVEVRGNEIIRHLMEGQEVLAYNQPQLDPRDSHAAELIRLAGGEKQLSGGTISLQSESHPVHFRKVELLDLSGH